MDKEICCAVEAPKRTVGDLVRENTEIIKNIEDILKGLNGFLFDDLIQEPDKAEIKCMYEEIDFQNYKLKTIIESLQKTKNRLN